MGILELPTRSSLREKPMAPFGWLKKPTLLNLSKTCG
jgi:hypothetical protein